VTFAKEKMELQNLTRIPFQDKFVFSFNNPELNVGDNSTTTIQNLEDLFQLRKKLIDDMLNPESSRPRPKRGYKVYDRENKVSKKGSNCPAGSGGISAFTFL